MAKSQGEVVLKVTMDDTDVNVKVEKLEKKTENFGDAAKKSIDQANFDKVAKEASNASGSMDDLAKEVKNASDSMDDLGKGMQDLPEQTKPASNGFTVFKGILANLGANVISTVIGKITSLGGALMDLIDETEEYRSMQAKVEASASTFGYSVDYAKEKYKDFYRYLADDQMATNAITNLMGVKVSTDTVSDAANAAIGVWSAYGDSIPIEGLTESINESAQVAKVTGSLADAINWARRSNEDWSAAMEGHSEAQKAFNKAIADGEAQEDAYSAALAACTDTQERADLIAKTLNQTYGQSKKTYDQLSKSTLDMHESELKLKDAQASLAESAIPLRTELNNLKARGLEALKPAVDKASDAMQDMVKDIDWNKFGDAAEDAMDIVIDALSFCVNHVDELSAALKAGAVAFGIYKTASLASAAADKVANAVKDVAAEKSLAAAAANKVLAASHMATPWGLIIGLVAGLSVGIVSYISSLAEAAKTENENAIATEELRKKYEDLHETIKSNQEARKENITNAEAETLVAENLAGKIEELAAKENKSNAEKELMAGYVDKLNEIYPDLNAEYDKEKDALNMSTQEIRNYITASKDMIMAKAYQENMMASAEDLAKAQMNLADAEEQVAKNQDAANIAHQKATEATDAYNKAVEEGAKNQGELRDAMNEAVLASADADKTLKDSKDTLSDYQDEVNELTDEVDKWGDKINESLDTEEFNKQVYDLVAKTREAGTEVPDALAQGIKEKKYKLPESVEEMQALVTYDNLVSKANEAGVTVPESITKGIKSGELKPSQAASQLQNLITFDDLLKKSKIAGKDVPDWLQKEIMNGATKPEDAVQYMKDLVTYNDLVEKSKKAGIDVPETIKQQIQSGQMKPKDAVQYMKDLIAYNDMLAAAKAAGVAVPEDVKNGVNSGKMKPRDAMNEVKNLMVQAAESSAQMNQKGKEGAQSYASGVDSEKGKSYDSGKNVAQQAKSGTESVSAYGSGQYLAQGFINGMSSMVGGVIGAAANIARNALNMIRRVGGEGSPWKTTIRSGQWAVEGLEIGMEKRSSSLVQTAAATVNEMGHAMYQSMQSTMGGLPLVMAESFNSAMPNAERSMASKVDKMRNKLQQAIGSDSYGRALSSDLSYANHSDTVINQTTNNFDQTINSPKHTSPSENAREAEKMMRRMAWK